MDYLMILLVKLSLFFPAVLSLKFTSYANDFIDPGIVTQQPHNSTRILAQRTIVKWANELAAQGPWSVVNKPITVPSGDKHDYLSWEPHWWPDCSGVGNTTVLLDEQIWSTCPYYQRDDALNPDVFMVNNSGDFDVMSNAVLYNAMAWILNGSDSYAANAARFVQTWFLDSDTAMNPNANFAHMRRGPNGSPGIHTGVLDMKGIAKVVNGILILQNGHSDAWTDELRMEMANWTGQYVQWLEMNPLGTQESRAPNHHGTFYYNQLAALKLLLGDIPGAQNATQTYFSTLFMDQIDGSGEQPHEVVGMDPAYYRAFHLAAIITNARIAQSAGFSAWNLTTTRGGTIKQALDYAMTVQPALSVPVELYPNIGAIGAIYSDPEGKYVAFLKTVYMSFAIEPWFYWNQPLGDGGYVEGQLVAESGSPSGPQPEQSTSAAATIPIEAIISWSMGRIVWVIAMLSVLI